MIHARSRRRYYAPFAQLLSEIQRWLDFHGISLVSSVSSGPNATTPWKRFLYIISSNLYVVRELAMYFLLVAALSSIALSSGSLLESRQSDPCARIVNQAWSKPSEVNLCLSSFPFNTTLRDNVADILSKTFSQFHTSTNFHLNMPDPFTEVTIDLLGELRRIKTTTYISDFAFHRDISTTFKRLGDSHAGYVNYCYDSLYSTYLPFPLAVLARPGAIDVQNIHIVPEASEVVANEFGDEAVEIWQAALGGRNLTELCMG
ncbi:unnamed protein product [Rhizoctonia solani]|nr:unnamed protein product [Rhizoctonia solani]